MSSSAPDLRDQAPPAPVAGDPPERDRPLLTRAVALGLVALFAVPFTVLGLLQSHRDGPTWDESIYLNAGLTALDQREIRINFEHPPLAKVLSAWPALLADPVIPTGAAYQRGDQWEATRQFNDANQEAGTFDELVALGRLVPLAVGVATGFLLYALGAAVFGRAAGLLAAGLWFTSPFALGLSHVMSIDAWSAFTALLVALALVRALRRDDWAGPVLVGLACGAALLTRHTGLILTAAAVLSVAVGGLRGGVVRTLLRAGGVAVLAFACVWAGYRALAPSPGALPTQDSIPAIIEDTPDEPPLTARLVTLLPWPEEYEIGVEYLARVSDPPAPIYYWGMNREGPDLGYWPAAMLMKLTPGFLLVLVGGLVLLARRGEGRRLAVLALLVPAAALSLFTVLTPRPIGLRYAAAGILLTLAASSGVVRLLRGRVGWAVLGVLALTQVAALADAHPYSIPWTTPPFRPAYVHTGDTNVDFSQDVWRVREWAQGRDAWVAYIGPAGYDADDITGARQLVGADHSQVTGDLAVFTSALTAYNRDDLSWLRAYCPTGLIGEAVLLYSLDGPPDLRPGPDRPALPCAPGAEISTRAD